MRARQFLLFFICAVLAFASPFVSGYAAEASCASQMSGEAQGAQKCVDCGPGETGSVHNPCCGAAAGAAVSASAAATAEVTLFQQPIDAASRGCRSIATSPGLQPPR